jgi:integrase
MGLRMAFRFAPDQCHLEGEGLGALARVPFLLSRDLVYLDEVNRFLRDRALGKWHPNRRNKSDYGRIRVLSDNALEAYSKDLENFWTYLEARGQDWRKLTYQQLRDSYDRDMGRGTWSEDFRPLQPSTINRRVDRAVEFLQWATDRGLRSPFPVETEFKSRSVATGKSAKRQFEPIEVRIGRRRPKPKHLRLPTMLEINRWLAEVAARHGKTLALVCNTPIELGTRLEETILVRSSQLPDPDSIRPGKPARMEICYGTKGGRSPGDPDLKGKPRTLRFAPAFLRELVNFKQLRRPKALALFRASHPGQPIPPQLFLSERSGEPITKAVMYKAWTECDTLPFPGFSPHTGRHAFACFTLLRLLDEETKLIARAGGAVPRSTLLQHAGNLISIYIRPVLGHISDETTERYVDWLADHLWVAEYRASWSAYLRGCDE